MRKIFEKGDLVKFIGLDGGIGLINQYGIVMNFAGRKNGTVFVHWIGETKTRGHYARSIRLMARAK
jgi:hypothetical protein